MSDFEVDFEWPVAKYEFRPASSKEIAKWRRQYNKDEWEDTPEAERPFAFGYIERSGEAQVVRHKSTALEQAVQKLVECEETSLHKVVPSIARTIGALSPPPKEYDSIVEWATLRGQLFSMFRGMVPIPQDEARTLYRIAQWPHPDTQLKGELGIYLAPGPDGKPKLTLRPMDLFSALVLSAARLISNGTTLGRCLNCKKNFLRGVGSKRRGDARFCSPRCKWEYHNEERRKAKAKS